MSTVGELVEDCILKAAAANEARVEHDAADKRLIDGLALIGMPLNPNSKMVIGNCIISRGVSYSSIEILKAPMLPDGAEVQAPVEAVLPADHSEVF